MGQLKRIVQLEDEVKKLKVAVDKAIVAVNLIGEELDKLEANKPESTWQKLIKNITQKTPKSEKES